MTVCATCDFRKTKITFRRKVYKLSPKKVDRADEHAELIRQAERGQRVGDIIDATGFTGQRFADELNKLAQAYGYPKRYDASKISKMRKGVGRGLEIEEGALLTLLDPMERGIAWLAFGGPPVKQMRRGKDNRA